MTDRESECSVARTTKRRTFRLFGDKAQLTPEELAARHAATTARKIKAIFSRQEPDEESRQTKPA